MLEEITPAFIENLATAEGGYTNRAFALLGLPMNPPKGWKHRVLGKLISVDPESYERARYTDVDWKRMVKQLDEAKISHNFHAMPHKPRPCHPNSKKARRRQALKDQIEATNLLCANAGPFHPRETMPRFG